MGSARTFAILIFKVCLIFSAVAGEPSSKIENKLLETFKSKTRVSVFVSMKNGTEEVLGLISSQKFNSREDRIKALAKSLKLHCGSTQQSVKDFLDENSVTYQSYWISNILYIPEATEVLVNQLAEFPSVGKLMEEDVENIEEPQISSVVKKVSKESKNFAPEWGVSIIGADQVWNTGNTGEGVVVGIIDTGVRGKHQDLILNYRDPYGWMDPSFVNMVPTDVNGHGTHALGIIVGTNGIGVAPKAKWAACKGCGISSCMTSHLIACAQWMVCPTLPDGTQEDCSKAVHLVSNTWTGSSSIFDPVLAAWAIANIIPIFGIGNSGPACNTANSYPANSERVIGVAATWKNDSLGEFSSKGEFGTIKPDISAPGGHIYSSFFSADDDYAHLTSTSMAASHVAGAVALILSKYPNLPLDDVKYVLNRGVETVPLIPCSLSCGGISGSTYPNDCYGHGRLNIFNSL